MSKRTATSKFKGELLVDLENETITITTVTKESEHTYDLLSELAYYDGKTIAISITEDKDIDPID